MFNRQIKNMELPKYLNTKLICIGILGLFIVSLHFYIINGDTYIGDEDAAAYALQGQSISMGNGLVSKVVWLFIKDYESAIHQEDYWPPLQSYLIAASITILGESLFTIKLPNVLIFLALIILVYLIGFKLFDQNVGILAALMCLFSTDISLYSISCRNEMFHIFVTTLCFFCGAKTIDNTSISYKYLCLSGVLIGIAFLQKPVALLLLISYFLWFLYKYYNLEKKEIGFYNLKHSSIGLIIFIFSFIAIISPYLIRNISEFKRILPPLPFKLSAIYLESYKNNPNNRTIDSDLSHYKEMGMVYYNKEPNIDYSSTSEIIYVAKKFSHEAILTSLMFKRSHIFQISLIFLATLSYFLIKGYAKSFLELFFIYLVLSILFISLHQHTEQRYYVFIIPVITIYASKMLFIIEKLIIKANLNKQNLLNPSKLYWVFIVSFLALIFILPNISFYANRIKKLNTKKEALIIGNWLRQNTPETSVIMSEQPHRMSYYANRTAIKFPMAKKDEILYICNRYNVSHIVLPRKINEFDGQLLDQGGILEKYSELKRIRSNVIFIKNTSDRVAGLYPFAIKY
jgi:hypothetical protein